MRKTSFLTAAVAAAALSIGSAHADKKDMEKCVVLDKDGNNIVKERHGDCSSGDHTCQAQNEKGEKDAWILVPKGECDKINKGDMSGVSDEIKDKIDHGMKG